jgi:hypothetical protein
VFSSLGSVVSSPNGGYVSPPALAQMDLVPGFEIIARHADSKEVYVFREGRQRSSAAGRVHSKTKVRAGVVVVISTATARTKSSPWTRAESSTCGTPNGTELIDGDSNPGTQGVFLPHDGVHAQLFDAVRGGHRRDGKNDLIVGSEGSQLFVFKYNGTIVTGFPYALTTKISGALPWATSTTTATSRSLYSSTTGSSASCANNGVQQTFQFFANRLAAILLSLACARQRRG